MAGASNCKVEWGPAAINATFGNYAGAASMPADVDSLAGIAAPRVTQSLRDYALDHIAPLEREGDDGDRDGEGASIARSIAPGPGENGPASGG
jgi:hypothetical protein